MKVVQEVNQKSFDERVTTVNHIYKFHWIFLNKSHMKNVFYQGKFILWSLFYCRGYVLKITRNGQNQQNLYFLQLLLMFKGYNGQPGYTTQCTARIKHAKLRAVKKYFFISPQTFSPQTSRWYSDTYVICWHILFDSWPSNESSCLCTLCDKFL